MKHRGIIGRLASGISRAVRAYLGEETFKGAQVNRLFMDWVTMGGFAPDDELKRSIRLLRARARDLARNNWCVRQYLTLLAVNVVGPTGFGMSSEVRDAKGNLDEKINDRIEDAWEDWANDPVTIDGKQTLVDLQHLLVKSVARDGEVFVRSWRGFPLNGYGVAFEVIDADLVDETLNRRKVGEENEIRMGIETDKWGRPVAYHIWNTFDQFIGRRERERVPADQIFHLHLPEYAKQTRGYPWIQAVMSDLKMLQGYFEAELVAARAGAAKMGWFVKKDGMVGEAPSDQNTELEANPGSIDFAPDGYEFQEWNPDHPSTAFSEFIRAVLRCVAAGMGVSYPTLTGDLESVNYATMRGGFLVERDLYRTQQRWLASSLNRWICRQWFMTALLTKLSDLDAFDFEAYAKACVWTPRGYAWIDPETDVKAAVLAIDNRLASRTSVLREQGKSIDTVLEEIEQEEEKGKAKGLDMKIVKPVEEAKPSANGNGNGNGAKPKNRIAELTGVDS